MYICLNLAPSDETQLIQTLMQGYERRARPVHNSSDRVNIHANLTPLLLMDLVRVHELYMIFILC